MIDIAFIDVFLVSFCLVLGLFIGYFIGKRGANVPVDLLGSIFLFANETIEALSDDGKFSKEEKEVLITRGQAIIYCISTLNAWSKNDDKKGF